MDLEGFMQLVGADDADVGNAVGRDRSTISRIRRGKVKPDGDTLLLLDTWAAAIAKKKRVRVNQRLSWDHLLSDDEVGIAV